MEYEPYPGFGDTRRTQYMMDGIPVPYEVASQLVGAGAATIALSSSSSASRLSTVVKPIYGQFCGGLQGDSMTAMNCSNEVTGYTLMGSFADDALVDHAMPKGPAMEGETGHGKNPCPPTQDQLRRSTIVKRAVKGAFERAAKDAKDPRLGWIEHGGWIAWNKKTNRLSIYPKEPRTPFNSRPGEKYIDSGTRVWLHDPGDPPPGVEFVATFHIHPNNLLDPPEIGDIPAADQRKAPGIVGLPNGDVIVYGNYNSGIVNGQLPPGCH
jgi:hypothetical protein